MQQNCAREWLHTLGSSDLSLDCLRSLSLDLRASPAGVFEDDLSLLLLSLSLEEESLAKESAFDFLADGDVVSAEVAAGLAEADPFSLEVSLVLWNSCSLNMLDLRTLSWPL